ncbi:MAG: hypothetical protein PHS37_09415 [Candidatus Omnitrophica bacterium]|nr:hypothetical protein [Candidatus Omnitrophota bacterium]
MWKIAKDEKSHKTLHYSFRDGVFASAMTGFTQDYFAPFLLLIGGTARHIGMLSALPNLCAAMLIPIALQALTGEAGPHLFIAMVMLFTVFGAIAGPPWASLMSDLVHEDRRGEYFGWRNRTLGYIAVAASFTAGMILTVMKKINPLYGFALLFAAALTIPRFLKEVRPVTKIRSNRIFSSMIGLAPLGGRE